LEQNNRDKVRKVVLRFTFICKHVIKFVSISTPVRVSFLVPLPLRPAIDPDPSFNSVMLLAAVLLTAEYEVG
jgi:hypothetical protein